MNAGNHEKHPIGCACCGTRTGPLFLHSRCHPAEPVWAMLNPDNTLEITCSVCDKVVTMLKVQPPDS